MEMIEKELGLHTPDILGIGGRDIRDMGIVQEIPVVADNLDIGILIKDLGIVDSFVINSSQNYNLSSFPDGFLKLLHLFCRTLLILRGNVEFGVEAVLVHYVLKVLPVHGPTVNDGIIRKQYGYLLVLDIIILGTSDSQQCYYGKKPYFT
jgi:hypothetical protein